MKYAIVFLFCLVTLAKGQIPSGANLEITPSAAGWQLDKNHSQVSFAVSHLVISEVTGRFRDFDIHFSGTKDDFSDATISAILKVDSLDTGNGARDRHLRKDDFFNAARYPEIRFQSTSFEKTGEHQYAIRGNLTIRDVTKPVVFDAALRGILNRSGGSIAAWKATLTINRFDYGLNWNRTIESGGLIAGEQVKITVVAELLKPNS